MTLALGLMSGTSADGISAVLANFQGEHFKILAYKTFPYARSTRKKLAHALHLRTPEISKLNVEIGMAFAEAAVKLYRQAKVSSKKVAVIGSHGQTIYHDPTNKPRHTFQIGEASVIAEKTGITVVSDFRTRDVAAGGQGAPLVPYFDFYFFGNGPIRAFQNIGGIANVCVVGRGIKPIAFDNGPGNSLLDWAAAYVSRGRLSYDKNGTLARQGRLQGPALRRLLSHPYFHKKPPKSTGKEVFGAHFLQTYGRPLLSKKKQDLLATLTFFTAASIHDSYCRFIFPKKWPEEIVVNGGGMLNGMLMDHLKTLFWPIPVSSIEKYGIHPLAKEALAFAFFALRALQGRSNHLPQTTGARHSCVLGKITTP